MSTTETTETTETVNVDTTSTVVTPAEVVNTVKKVTLISTLDFCDLPKEDTQTDVEKTEKNKLKNDLKVTFTRVNVKQVYGSKKEKIDASKENIALVGKFLESYFKSQNASDDEEKVQGESFEDWRNRLTLQRVQIQIMTNAKNSAISNEKMSVESFENQFDAMLNSGKVDDDAIARFQAKLDAMKNGSKK
jgi:hypothetical protein